MRSLVFLEVRTFLFLLHTTVHGDLGHMAANATDPRQLLLIKNFPNGYLGAFQNLGELSVVIVTGPLPTCWP